MYKILGADGKEYGPVSGEVLRQWVAEGRANAQTKVLLEGAVEWKRLEEIPEFGPAHSGTPRLPSFPAPLSPLPSGRRTNGLALAGLVLGILSLTLGLCCYGLPFNIAGLVCSLAGLAQIRRDPQREAGQGMAIAGLVLSVLSFLLSLVILVLYLSLGGGDWMRHIRRL